VSPRSWKERKEDILICARNIKSFTVGMSFEEFLDDPKTLRAVAYEFITMGEAARTIPEDVQEKYPDVPWGKMQAIRNVLVYEYFRLDEEILWNASQEDIPSLIAILEKIN
jgi:uncharacterized protein with HEPN domain